MAWDLVGEKGEFDCIADRDGCCNTRAPFDPVGSGAMPRSRPAFERPVFRPHISSGAIQAFKVAAPVEACSVFLRRNELQRGGIDRQIARAGHSCRGKVAAGDGCQYKHHFSLDVITDPGGA